MTRYYVEPEVAGEWGVNTEADTTVHPPRISRLHYELSGWLGDDLLETFPCYIVSANLRQSLESSNLTGFEFDNVEVSASPEFVSDTPADRLPKFFWLKITGRADEDFALAANHQLVVSDEALSLLHEHRIDHAEVVSVPSV